MSKQFFFLKLLPPRPTYAMDMTESERAAMQRHILYWNDLTEKGVSILFGPVMDPEAPYGIGIVEVEGEQEARTLAAQDPAIQAGIGCHYEVMPMRIGMLRTAQQPK